MSRKLPKFSLLITSALLFPFFSVFADAIQISSSGAAVALLGETQASIHPAGEVIYGNQGFDCSTRTEKSFTISSSIVQCANDSISIASPAGVFAVDRNEGAATLTLTNGSIERIGGLSPQAVVANSGTHTVVTSTDSTVIIENAGKNIVVDRPARTGTTASGVVVQNNGATSTYTITDGTRGVTDKEVEVGVQGGMNVLAGAIGGSTTNTTGNAAEGAQAAAGIETAGKVVSGLAGGALRGLQKAGVTAVTTDAAGNVVVHSQDGSTVQVQKTR